jgi:hypothetical protein
MPMWNAAFAVSCCAGSCACSAVSALTGHEEAQCEYNDHTDDNQSFL